MKPIPFTKIKSAITLKRLFAICIIILAYLFALNGRYHFNDTNVFDKWTGKWYSNKSSVYDMKNHTYEYHEYKRTN